MYATKEKRWDKIDHTSFVLGITCIRDKEVMVPEKAHILSIRDNMYYGQDGKLILTVEAASHEIRLQLSALPGVSDPKTWPWAQEVCWPCCLRPQRACLLSAQDEAILLQVPVVEVLWA